MKLAYALLFLAASVPGLGAAQISTKPKVLPARASLTLATEVTAELRDRGFSGAVQAGDVAWTCAKGLCRARVAGKLPDLPACSALAARAGAVTRFSAAGSSLDAKALAECNRSTATIAANVTQPQARLSPQAGAQVQATPAAAAVLRNRQRFAELGDLRARAEAEARRQRDAETRSRQDAQARQWEQRRIALGYTHRHSAGRDCDDTRRDIHPLAAEVCDNRDNNCDGYVDEGQKLAFFLDADGDGHGDPSQRIEACAADQQQAAREGRWLSLVGNDCDDADPTRWQGCP